MNTIIPDATPFHYSCPVDHLGNSVVIRGWFRTDKLTKPPFILIHDVGENIRMYKASAEYICMQGYSCYSYDQRRQSETQNGQTHPLNFDSLSKDLLQVVSWIRKTHGGTKPILVGQGYGCLIASEMVTRYPGIVEGMVLSAPTIELARPPSKQVRLIIKFLAESIPNYRLPKFLRPRFSNPLHRDLGTTITKRVVDNLIREDDLPITANFAWELIAAMERTPRILANLNVHTLVIRPEADEIANTELIGYILSYKLAQNKLIDSQSVPQLHHNALTESLEGMKMVADLTINWTHSLQAKSNFI